MRRPDERDEDELIFARLIKALHYSFTKTTIARDGSSIAERDRYFEKFEIYMYLPPSLQELDAESIEGMVFFDQLGYEAVRCVEDYYAKIQSSLVAPPAGIGIHTETEWRFGAEVLEAEGMLGDKQHPNQTALCFSFWVRFIQPLGDTARRWKTKKRSLPPPVKTGNDFKTWFIDENGVVTEHFEIPDAEIKEITRSYHLRPEEEERAFPPRQQGYEEEPEEETELDWKDY